MIEQIQAIQEIKELTSLLLQYAESYYVKDQPLVTDQEYDKLYDKLEALEKQTGFVMANSPTHKVQGRVLEGFTKVQHSKPMLSAAKTKDVAEVDKWINGRAYYASAKLDGLTLCVLYSGGKLVKAVTRGNGYEGEDVTEQAKLIGNLPLEIPHEDDLELRGECVISWDEFKRINDGLDVPYAHPRNLAAGTLRCLDLNVVKARKLSWVAFECITDVGIDDKIQVLILLAKMGFTTVPMCFEAEEGIQGCIDTITPTNCPYPMDGVIFELRSRSESLKTGATEHHEGCRLALKWADDTYPTTLRDIEWNTSRSGTVCPVAVFDPVNIEGTEITRATLHNVSIIRKLQLGIGDTINILKANMVIPAIDSNDTQSNTYELPRICPSCGSLLKIEVSDTGTQILRCPNSDECPAQRINKLIHYCSKNAMNIEGLSDQTIQLLADKGYLNNVLAIYRLSNYPEIAQLPGFGEKSYKKLLEAIEKSTHTTLDRVIYALGIEGIGRKAAKTLAEHFKTWQAFITACQNNYDFTILEDVGSITQESIIEWYNLKRDTTIMDVLQLLDIAAIQETVQPCNLFTGKSIAVTGKLEHYTRDTINQAIESIGGRVVGSVSAKTDYLINNDPDSPSSKNQQAHKFNIPIITEQQFQKMAKII